MSLRLLGRSLLGALVFAVCAYLVIPTLIVVPVSFTQTDYIAFPPKGFSFQWYKTFLDEGPWRNATLNSFLVASASALLATTVGTLAALGLKQLPRTLARFAIWIVLLPMVVPTIIMAVALYGVFAPLDLVGTKIGLILAHTLMTLPFVVINVSAVMQKMDWRMVDAARSLGASPITSFWKVTLPAILPGVVAGLVFAFLTSFDEVVVALFVTGIDSMTLPVQMWNGIRFEISPTVAAASTILLLLSIFALAAYGTARRLGRSSAMEGNNAMNADTGRKSGIGASIQISALTKNYANFKAVDTVSLDVAPGEFVTLLGSSGSGKTTTLMAVAGFVKPSSGSIRIGDRDISGLPPEKRGLGVVFQSYALFPHYDVFENVAFPLRLRRLPEADIRAKVTRALELVDLGAFAKRRIAALSGGQQQRVALARAIVFSPPVLLMDEPLGALDRKLREQLQTEIKRIQRDIGATVLYVTHDQEEALAMSDRLAIMRHGRITQIGAPDDVYARPESPFAARFLGESNFVPVRFIGRDGSTVVVETESAAPRRIEAVASQAGMPQGEVIGMIRPEAIRIGPASNEKIPATVDRCEFLGPTIRLTLTTDFGPLTARLSRMDCQQEITPGATVGMSWEAKDMVLFGRDEATDSPQW